MQYINPLQSIVPIVKWHPAHGVTELLGTGFFVGQAPIIITAKHILKSSALDPDEEYAAVQLASEPGQEQRIYSLPHHTMSEKFDILAFYAEGISGAQTLKLSTRPVSS